MNAPVSNLLIAWFSSLGDAYLAANMFCDERVSLMEIFPAGPRGHLILRGPENMQSLLHDVQKHFDRSLFKAKFISNCDSQILNAYLSTDLAEMRESLLIAETEFIGDLFEAAQYARTRQLGVMDLRFLRGTSSASFLFLTGSAEELKPFAKQLRSEGIKAQVLDQPQSVIRSLFSLPS